ncbi:hypothetical protein WH390_14985 (plasmid) [Candidatus Arsenophonus nilaparvatae]|uniref:hypothetical protein n=1 Tax=Candidatus Arsenophonus nilaparvatae TaxID=1247023 RepID=UPI000509B356
MTERKKLSLNRPRKASPEEQTSSNPVYGKKVWVNAVPKKQVKKPHPPKVAKQQPKKPVVKPKQEVKVKTPKPPIPPCILLFVMISYHHMKQSELVTPPMGQPCFLVKALCFSFHASI